MKKIAVLGMPNTGKSTFYNRLTGSSAKVGNWPGITVDLMSAKVLLGSHMVEVIDLPGIYDLKGFSDDEKVVQLFLETQALDLIVLVINAVQIERQLILAMQLKKLGIPFVLLLNMADEAKKLGVEIFTENLSDELQVPVSLMSAKFGHGYQTVCELIAKRLDSCKKESQSILLSKEQFEKISEMLSDAKQLEEEEKLILSHSTILPKRLPENLTTQLDKILLHPILGIPIFFMVMYLVFESVFALAKPLQESINAGFNFVKTDALVPLLDAIHAPIMISSLITEGVFTGLGTVATFAPLIIIFFLFLAIIEDSGYLSRAAFLMDSLMSKMGLDGRSFVMIMMGFGCNIPSVMGTRVMRSNALRLLTMLIIPFSLCSARLQAFLFIISALFPSDVAPKILFTLYLISFISMFMTALIFKRGYVNTDPFILEMPLYRLPTGRQIANRAWQEVKHFLHRATKFITLGVILTWFLTTYPSEKHSFGLMIGEFLDPVFSPLGINPTLTLSLIFGFVAKEVLIGALAVIYGQEGDALMKVLAHDINSIQAYSFMIFTLLYIPCLSTVATIKNESKSLKFTLVSVGWSLAFAWTCSFIFYQIASRI